MHLKKFIVSARLLSCLLIFLGNDVRAGSTVIPVEHRGKIGEGISLFVPAGCKAAGSSFAFADPPRESGEIPTAWTLVPEFALDEGKQSASLKVPSGSSLYGTGEVTGPLLRNGKTITLWNTDNYAYGKDGGRRLYQSHPWVLGVRPDGTAFGVLFDTTSKGELTTDNGRIVLKNDGDSVRMAVIDRESPLAVVRGLAELTGKMPLPPKWALGFHQCRYSYYPDAKVREIATEFRKRGLPCDGIWMDIHYMDGYRVFTFDPNRFPDPKGTNDYLHANGFHSVWMIDPGVKVDPKYSVYESGHRAGLFVQGRDGQEFHGKVWPGVCAFPDFTMPSTRRWWADLYGDFLAKGVDGVWNDMNEPSVFETPEGTMPEDNWHRGGEGLPAAPHRLYHNVYGMLMTRATRDGILKAEPTRRPFLLTRSNYLGGQRYAATWTGDNSAGMEFLQTSIPMSLNLGLSGQPLSGPDIGGYSGAVTPDLFGRWIALGPFFPFFRAHTAVDNPPREPWAFGPAIEQVSRTALERRYRLLPYLYTLAYRASISGDPIMQPIFFADPTDARLRHEDRAFLFGPDLLIIPTWAHDPALPKGIWREASLLSGERERDGYQPSIRIRGGAIIPLGRPVQNTGEPSLNPLTLLVCLDEKGHAQGSIYEDAGEGFGYQNGEFALTEYEANQVGDSVFARLRNRAGRLKLEDREVCIRLVTESGVSEAMGFESKEIKMPSPRSAQTTRAQ